MMINPPESPEDSPAEDCRPPSPADLVPLTATVAARATLGDYYAYAALVALGTPETGAHEETGAPLAVHAARLAAEVEHLLAENAALRVMADGAIR